MRYQDAIAQIKGRLDEGTGDWQQEDTVVIGDVTVQVIDDDGEARLVITEETVDVDKAVEALMARPAMPGQHSVTVIGGELATKMFHEDFEETLTDEADEAISAEGQVQTFEFDTAAELAAFTMGYDEGNGWLEYAIVEKDERTAYYQPSRDYMPAGLQASEVFLKLANGLSRYPDIPAENWSMYRGSDIADPVFLDGDLVEAENRRTELAEARKMVIEAQSYTQAIKAVEAVDEADAWLKFELNKLVRDGRVQITIEEWFSNSGYADTYVYAYNSESAEMGMDPWRAIDPDKATDGSGYFLHWNSKEVVAGDTPVFVQDGTWEAVNGRKLYQGGDHV